MSPSKSPESPPLLPPAINPTPRNETAVASQKAVAGRSSPASRAMTPTKIGVVPRTSPTVEADVRWTEPTKQSWFRKIRSAATPTSLPSESRIRNERSRCQVKPQKSEVAAR
jgi:hypothetical protein